jgi:hypothetical protein
MADGGNIDPAAAAYFASLPDGAARLAQAQAIAAEVAALDAARATPPALSVASSPAASASPLARESAAVSQAAASPEANREETVRRIFAEQLGRAPEQAALNWYVGELAKGVTPQRISEEIDRTVEGFNYDTQNIVSAYRKAFGRDPDQAGYQFYMGQEDQNLMNTVQIADLIKGGARGTDVQALKDNPQGFLQMTGEALRADPFSGMYAVDDPYLFSQARLDAAKDTPNVSQTAAGQYVQFVSPITQRPMFSGYTNDGQYRVYAGNDVLQPERVRQTVNLATQSGALSQADANRILEAISTPEKYRQITGNKDPQANTLYALLADPKATVVLDALGVQIGEDADAAIAMDEKKARQDVVDRIREETGQDVNPSTIRQEQVAQQMNVRFPFTQDNLTKDPLTGKPIRTFMTKADVENNLFTYLNIPTDKTIKNVFTQGLGTYDPTKPSGLTPGGGTPTTPPAVVGTTGDFRGLAFPQARPTEVGETPAMLGFQPYTLTQPGSGQQKTTEPQPVIPVSQSTVDPKTGALLGATIGSLLPTPSSGAGFLTGVNTILDAVTGKAVPIDWNQGASVQETPSTYYTPQARNIINSGSGYYKEGGMATPLMKEGGMVPHYADGGASQVALGLEQIFNAPSTRGALFGALMSQLLNAQAQSQAANAYKGIDMSKVGVIPPRTTQVGPARFAPYRQYASRPEIPASVSSPINVGALRASQTPMTSFTPTQTMANPLARPMADGGAVYYTYGQQVDPMDYLRGMAQGGMAHGGLHGAQHTYDVPTVDGRKDYRQGSAVTGAGDGQSDDIPAMLADGEYVFDADTVAQLGNGSTKAGSQMLDKFREEIRQHKRSAPVHKIPPPSKSPLAYLAAAQKKMKGASRG